VLAATPRGPVTALQPFGLSPDPHFIYRSDPYIWAFEQVTTAVRQREGLVLITGDPGTGKTLLCRTLLSRLSERHAISVVLDPHVSFEELLTQVLQDFGVLPDRQAAAAMPRHDLVATLHRFLASLIPLNTTAVLVIDEAQHLHPAVLEELRLLSNCESDHAKLLQIVLVGTSALDDICRSEPMRHLDQRIARRCRLRALEHNEVAEYVANRLSVAGFMAGAFSAPAVRAIATMSGGVPRTINLLCERSLDIAGRRGISTVDLSAVQAAARQLEMRRPRGWFVSKRTAMVASVLLVGLPSATWLCASQTGRLTHQTAAPVAATSDTQHPAIALASVTAAPVATPIVPEAPVPGTLSLADGFTIQVASFRSGDRTAAIVAQLRDAGLPAYWRLDPSGAVFVVLVGPYVTDGEIQGVQQQLATQGFTQGRVRHEDAGALLP
jgi:general secretion pathway protein A